jgi:hypothetical protein
MPGLDPALVGAQEPASEEREGTVNSRKELGGLLGVAADRPGSVSVAVIGELAVVAPTIGLDHRALVDVRLHEVGQGSAREVLGQPQAQATRSLAHDLHRRHHSRLAKSLAASHAILRTADRRFVYLDLSSQTLSPRPDHRAPKLVQPRPRRLVAPQAQLPLEALRRDPRVLAGHQEHRLEPQPQRPSGPMEDSARGHRGLVPAAGAFEETTPGQPPRPTLATPWTAKPVRPPLPDQIRVARLLGREAFLQLDRRFRKVPPTPSPQPLGRSL